MAAGTLRGLVATASLDLGIDWGDVDLVIQMGAPKGSSRLLQRIGRANHRLDEPSKGIIVPGNRFEYLEARAALDAIDDGELDPEVFRPGALDVLAQHILAMAVAAPFQQERLLAEVRSAAPYAGLKRRDVRGDPELHRHGRICAESLRTFPPAGAGGRRHVAHRQAERSRSSIGSTPASSSNSRCSPFASATAASSARSRKATPRPFARRPFLFLRTQPRGRAVQGHRHHRPRVVQAARIVTYGGSGCRCRPTSPTGSGTCCATATTGAASPTMSANGSRCSPSARSFPSRTSCWSRPSRTKASISWSPTASKVGTRTSRSEC